MSEEQAVSFKEKLRSVHFSPATKNPGARKNYYDEQALRDGLLHADKEEEMARTNGVGFMRRDKQGDFYRKDRITGDYIKAAPSDVDKVLGNGRTMEEGRRVFGGRSQSVSGSGSGGG